jgi:hypothetical protein
MKIKSLKRPLLALSVCLLVSTNVRAEDNIFKNSEFLTWEKRNQEFYIRTSIGMATIVIAQYDKSKARCVSDAFNADENGMYTFVLDVMKRFPDYPPKGTVLAVIEKKCGKLSN